MLQISPQHTRKWTGLGFFLLMIIIHDLDNSAPWWPIITVRITCFLGCFVFSRRIHQKNIHKRRQDLTGGETRPRAGLTLVHYHLAEFQKGGGQGGEEEPDEPKQTTSTAFMSTFTECQSKLRKTFLNRKHTKKRAKTKISCVD